MVHYWDTQLFFILFLFLISIFGEIDNKFWDKENSLPKECFFTCSSRSCCPWHITCLRLFTVTSFHSIQKRNSWELGNKMEGERRFKAQKTEIELICKKVWGKRKEKYSRKKVIHTLWEILILLLKNKSHQKIYILRLVSKMYHQSLLHKLSNKDNLSEKSSTRSWMIQ